MKGATPDNCPPASVLVDFVERGPKSKNFAALAAHLGRCPACRQTVLEMRSVEATLAAQPKPGFKWGRLWSPAALAGTAAVLAVASVPILSHRFSNLTGHPKPAPERVAMGGTHSIKRSPAKISTPKIPANPAHPAAPVNKIPGQTLPTQGTLTPGSTGSEKPGSTLPAEKDPDMSQLYCLVGPDHVYALDPSDANLAKRRQIEEDYADQISEARREYVHRLTSGAGRAERAHELNQRLKRAADLRDRRLGSLYRRNDDLLKSNPGLKLEGNGPYQVVKIGYRTRTRSGNPADFSFLPPWPGYRPADRTFAPNYHVRYSPQGLKQSYLHAEHEYVAAGKPAFTGLVGHSGPVVARGLYESENRDYVVKLTDETRANPEVRVQKPSGPGAYIHSEASERHEPNTTAPAHDQPSTKPADGRPAASGPVGSPGGGERNSTGDGSKPNSMETDSSGYVHTTERAPSPNHPEYRRDFTSKPGNRDDHPSDYTHRGTKVQSSPNSGYRRGQEDRSPRRTPGFDPSSSRYGRPRSAPLNGYRSYGNAGGSRGAANSKAPKSSRGRDQGHGHSR